MKEKKIVTLDLTDCKYLGEIHQRIKKAFHFLFLIFTGKTGVHFGICYGASVMQTK